VLCFANKEHAF